MLSDESVSCIDEEITFEILASWEWSRLGNICQLLKGKTPPRGGTSLWLYGIYLWISIFELLMSFKLTIGRTSILKIDAFHNEAIITILPICDDNNSLRNYLFRTLPLLSNMGDSKDAIKGKTLNSQSLNNLLIPLPPQKEASTICQMIDGIFATINESMPLSQPSE